MSHPSARPPTAPSAPLASIALRGQSHREHANGLMRTSAVPRLPPLPGALSSPPPPPPFSSASYAADRTAAAGGSGSALSSTAIAGMDRDGWARPGHAEMPPAASSSFSFLHRQQQQQQEDHQHASPAPFASEYPLSQQAAASDRRRQLPAQPYSAGRGGHGDVAWALSPQYSQREGPAAVASLQERGVQPSPALRGAAVDAQQQQQQRHSYGPATSLASASSAAPDDFGRIVGAAMQDLTYYKQECQRKDATIQGLQREMAEMRSRDAMYAGLLSATAQHEHEAVTLRGEAHQLREELGAIHGRATHLQSERDSMMLKMERGHEELHRSQAARRELEERVAAMEAEQQQAAARFAALQGGLEEKDATIQQLQNRLDTSVKAAQEEHERLRSQGETELQAAKTRADESEARVAELERRLKEAEQAAHEAQEVAEKVQFELELSHALLEENAHTHDESLASAIAKADEFRAAIAAALHAPPKANLAELEKAAAELYQLAQTTTGHQEQTRRAEEERHQASAAIREQLELVHECVVAICTEGAGESEFAQALRAGSDGNDSDHSENDASSGDGTTRIDRPGSKNSRAAAAAAAHASGDSDASSAAVDRRRRRQQQARRRHERRHAANLPLAASLRPLKFQLSAALRRSPKEGSPLADVAHHTLDSLMQLMTWFEAALKREQVRAEADFAQERASLLGAKRGADERAAAAESTRQLASESVERGREAVTQLQAQLSSKADALSKAQAGESAAIVRAVSASEAAAAAQKRADEAAAALEDTRRRLADLERDFDALSQKRARSHSHSRGRSRSAARNDDGALRDAAASRGGRAHSASPGLSRRPLGTAADASNVPRIKISSAAASERTASEAAEADDAGPYAMDNARSGLDDDDESGTASEGESGCPGCAEAWARLDTSEAALGEAAAAERRASTALAAQERLVKELRDAGYVRMSRLRDLEGELRLAQASMEEKQAAAQREEERLSRELTQVHEKCHAQQARLAELEETVAQSSDARALQQYRGEVTELRNKVAALEARLTDVRADLNDDLKAQLLDLQEELDEARRERDEERQSRDERRQAAALQIATLKAEINVRDNTIESLRETVALLQRDDSKELIKKFEERVEELEEEKRLVEAQVEEQRGLVAVANERISFLEDMRQKDDTVSRLEARLEKSKALIDELKQASEEDAMALRDLRGRVLEHESELEAVRKELRARTLQLEDARALGRYFVAQVETLSSDIVTALGIHNPPRLAGEVWQELPSKEAAAEDLQAQLLLDMSEAQRKKRWEKSLSKLQEEMLGEIRRVHGEAERLAGLESRYKNDADRIVEVMKMQCDERVRLLEAKLQRKETVLAGYDKDLGQLHLLKAQLEEREERITAEQSEVSRLKKKLEDQQDLVAGLRDEIENQKNLNAALRDRRQHLAQQEHENAMDAQRQLVTEANARALELEKKLRRVKTENTTHLRQKNDLVASLRKELQDLQQQDGSRPVPRSVPTVTAETQTELAEPPIDGSIHDDSAHASLMPRPPPGSARSTPGRRAVKLYKRDVSDPLVDSINNTLRSVGSAEDAGLPLN